MIIHFERCAEKLPGRSISEEGIFQIPYNIFTNVVFLKLHVQKYELTLKKLFALRSAKSP